MRISDWSSDVCSSDLAHLAEHAGEHLPLARGMADGPEGADHVAHAHSVRPTQWTPRRRLKQRPWPGPGSAGRPPQTGVIPSAARDLLVRDKADPSLRSGWQQQTSGAARSVAQET